MIAGERFHRPFYLCVVLTSAAPIACVCGWAEVSLSVCVSSLYGCRPVFRTVMVLPLCRTCPASPRMGTAARRKQFCICCLYIQFSRCICNPLSFFKKYILLVFPFWYNHPEQRCQVFRISHPRFSASQAVRFRFCEDRSGQNITLCAA